MPGNEDIMIEVSAELQKALDDFKKLENSIKETKSSVDNSLSPSVNNAGNRMTQMGNKMTNAGKRIKSALKTETALAFTAAGAAAAKFTRDCVDSAIKSESAWTRFGALVNSSGGNWEGQQKEIKSWATTFSNSMGYAVSDTREAASALMQFGMTFQDVQSGMNGVAALAARTGMTQADATNVVISAMNGRAMQLKKMTGLEIENYKAADGSIDAQRLLTDIYNQNKDALEKHATTTEGAINRVNNAWGAFKTGIGQALLPVINILADIIQSVVTAFNKMPGPIKTVIAVVLVIGTAISLAVGALGLLAPVLINLGTIISAIGTSGGIIAAITEAFPGLGAVIAGVGATLMSVLWPILAVVGAFAALYAVGVAMGWWTDLGSMLQVIGGALQQVAQIIWNELINAWNTVVSAMQPVIDTLGKVWEELQKAWNILMNATGATQQASGGLDLLAVAGQTVRAVFTPLYIVFQIFATALNIAAQYVLAFIRTITVLISAGAQIASVLGQLLSGQISFGEAWQMIVPIVQGALTQIRGIFMNFAQTVWQILDEATSGILSGIVSWAQGMWDGAVSAGTNFVEGIVQTITGLPDQIMQLLGNLGGMIMDMFTSLFNNLPGDTMTNAIMALMNPLPTIILGALNLLFPQVLPAINAFIQSILSGLGDIGNMISQVFSSIIPIMQQKLMQAAAVGGMLVSFIRMSIVNGFHGVLNGIRFVFSFVVQVIRTRLNQARAVASMLSNMIRQAIVNRFNQIIGRARQIFSRIVSTIRSMLSNAVSTARSKASEIYNNIVNEVTKIPQRVGDELGKIPGKIQSALASAAAAALSGAKNIVSSFLSGLGIASPGLIQRNTAWEFGTLPGIIQSQGVLATEATSNAAKNITEAWLKNKPDLDASLSASFDDFSRIPQLPEIQLDDISMPQLPEINFDDIALPTLPQLDLGVGGQNFSTITTDMNNDRGVTGSNLIRTGQGGLQQTVNNDDHTIVYNISKIALECNNLSKAESRQILYNALDGLYTKGV